MGPDPMLWFYARDSKTLRAETLYDNDTGEYVLVLHWPDGRTETERFGDNAAFQARVVALQRYLDRHRWAQQGPPTKLAYGWPRSPEDPVDPIH